LWIRLKLSRMINAFYLYLMSYYIHYKLNKAKFGCLRFYRKLYLEFRTEFTRFQSVDFSYKASYVS